MKNDFSSFTTGRLKLKFCLKKDKRSKKRLKLEYLQKDEPEAVEIRGKSKSKSSKSVEALQSSRKSDQVCLVCLID